MEYMIREVEREDIERLKTIILLRFDSLANFASHIGKSRQSVHAMFNGVYNLSTAKFLSVCKVLGINPLDIINHKKYVKLIKNENNQKNVKLDVDNAKNKV